MDLQSIPDKATKGPEEGLWLRSSAWKEIAGFSCPILRVVLLPEDSFCGPTTILPMDGPPGSLVGCLGPLQADHLHCTSTLPRR